MPGMACSRWECPTTNWNAPSPMEVPHRRWECPVLIEKVARGHRSRTTLSGAPLGLGGVRLRASPRKGGQREWIVKHFLQRRWLAGADHVPLSPEKVARDHQSRHQGAKS